jgi:hypothetical protein
MAQENKRDFNLQDAEFINDDSLVTLAHMSLRNRKLAFTNNVNSNISYDADICC